MAAGSVVGVRRIATTVQDERRVHSTLACIHRSKDMIIRIGMMSMDLHTHRV